MIFFDCEKMKYPNTGLFFFCDMLAKALSKESANYDEELGFYVPKQLVGRWGKDYAYRCMHKYDKLYFHLPNNTKLWHTTYQLSRYIPNNPKLLLTVHDLNFLYEKPQILHKKYLKRLQNIINKADYITTISETSKKDLLTYIDIKNKPIEVIYNGCNIYHGPITEPRYLPKHPFLFSIGTILPKKNFHVLPHLLQGNDYELILAGNHSVYELQIMAEAKKAGVTNRINIIGNIPEGEKHWYLKNCAAFVFPSIAEGFGLPVIEAMYYQRPIFLSQHTCLPEIGGPYCYYFNQVFDPDGMKEEFNAGMADFEQGNINKELMRKHAESFSWEEAAQRYWKIYTKLLNE